MFFRKKVEEVKLNKEGNIRPAWEPKPPVMYIYMDENPFVKIPINEKIVSAFNRLVYAYDIDKKFPDDVHAAGSATVLIMRRTTVDYFIHILRKYSEQLTGEERQELTEIFEKAIVGVPPARTLVGRIEQRKHE